MAAPIAQDYTRACALLVECDPGCTLGGSCTRDVENMAMALSRAGFLRANIFALDTGTPGAKIAQMGLPRAQSAPNRAMAIFTIAQEILKREPTLFVMLLTGHGYSCADVSSTHGGDEIDGADEAVRISRGSCTHDLILDDQIYEQIVAQLKCPAVLLADTCHSGTMFDLPFLFNGVRWISASRRTRLPASAFAIDAPIISLSACDDRQLSMCDIGDSTGFGGSLVTAILNTNGLLLQLLQHKNLRAVWRQIQERLTKLNQTCLLCAKNEYDMSK